MLEAFSLETVLKWAKDITGKSVTSHRETLTNVVRQALEVLYEEESLENLRKICVCSCGCSVSIPQGFGDPIRYKINGKIGEVNSKLYDFKGYVRTTDICKKTYRDDIIYDGEYATFFDVPKGGARIAVRALEYYSEDANPYVVAQGIDIHGRKAIDKVETEKGIDVGERVYIAQPNMAPIYSKHIFKGEKGSISSIRVVNANVPVEVLWVTADEYGDQPKDIGLLARLDADCELSCFKRYSIPNNDCSCCYQVEFLLPLERPKLKCDSELIRGFTSNQIQNMIKSIHYSNENDINSSQFNRSLSTSSLRRRNEKMAKQSDSIEICPMTSAGKFRKCY